MRIIQKIRENLKEHLVVTTALLTECTPIYSAFETLVAGMSDTVSINARLFVTKLSYLGLGWAFTKGRSISRDYFSITEQTKEKIQSLHDAAYATTFNMVLGPAIYYACGARDTKEIAVGTLCAMGIATINGAPAGYAIDISKDLTGLEPCERKYYPNFIKKQSPNIKKTIAAGLVAASIGLSSLIYSLTPDKDIEKSPTSNTPEIRQTSDNELLATNKHLEEILDFQNS
jgi:hypothetical protein